MHLRNSRKNKDQGDWSRGSIGKMTGDGAKEVGGCVIPSHRGSGGIYGEIIFLKLAKIWPKDG